MSSAPWFPSSLAYRIAVLLRGESSVFRGLELLRDLEFAPAAELVSRQDGKLAEILTYARRHSAFYRNRWPAGSKIDNLTARSYLQSLPLVSKADLQDHADEMLAIPRIRRVTRKTTGGSTGQAVTIVKDRRALGLEMAATWLGYGWFGVHIGDKQARFWGRPSSVRRRMRTFGARLATRRIDFSAFAFSDQDLERYWRRCLAERPDYFYGYVSMIEAFASFVLRRGLDGGRIGLKVIVTTSEVLGEPQRRLIQRAFGAPVQNEYGCGEVGAIAYECERGALHTMSENLIVEVLDEHGNRAAPGQEGQVVLTDLNNRAMPLIRYRVGDLAVLGTRCACGRGFPTLEEVRGREYDFIQDNEGRRYHGEYIMYLFEDLRERGVPVHQFQVIQLESGALEVLVVSDVSSLDSVVATVVDEMKRRLPNLLVTGRGVDAIERTKSGKMQLIRNNSASGQPHTSREIGRYA